MIRSEANHSSGRIRILFPYVGDTIGGSHISSILLVEQLHLSEEYEPVVAIHRKDGSLLPWLRERGIEPLQIPLDEFVSGDPRTPFSQLKTWIRITPYLQSWLRKLNIRIVHTHDLRMHFSWLWASRFNRSSQIWHKRNQQRDSLAWGLIMRQASFVVCVSRYTMGRLDRWIPESRLAVIDNPFLPPPAKDRTTAATKIRQSLGCTQETKLIVTVGTVSRFKRTDIFIKACGRIASLSSSPCRFVILGRTNGRERDLLKLATTEGIADSLVIAGFRNDVDDWVAAADLLLAPSEGEPLGRSIIESMFLGTPVVASDSGGNPEIIGDSSLGRLVELDNCDAFAAASVALLNNSEQRDAIATSAREYVNQRFNAERHCKEISRIYEKICRTKAK